MKYIIILMLFLSSCSFISPSIEQKLEDWHKDDVPWCTFGYVICTRVWSRADIIYSSYIINVDIIKPSLIDSIKKQEYNKADSAIKSFKKF